MAFGATLMSEGSLARRNPFRFSSEYADDETGLVYYNWRHDNLTPFEDESWR